MDQRESLHIQYGTTKIPFQLIYRKRKTLSISVTPDKVVTVTAPLSARFEKILQTIEKRAGWICKQIRKFEIYEEKLPTRRLEYVSGETFFYKGRKYRLKVSEGMKNTVSMDGRYLKVTVKNKKDEKQVARRLLKWYRQEAKSIFPERLERYKYILKREKISVNQLMVRRLQKRWGSCTENGNIILNLSLVQAPVQCIDYVIVHEICHLKFLNHGAKFYGLVSRYMEDWEKNKERLQKVALLE